MTTRSVDFIPGVESFVTGANGTITSVYLQTVTSDYTFLDDDDIGTVRVIDTTSLRTITLPTAADNESRIIRVINDGSETGNRVIVEGEGAETIDGLDSIVIWFCKDDVTVQSNGTSWHVIGTHPKQFLKSADGLDTPNFYEVKEVGDTVQQFAGHEFQTDESGSGTDIALYKFSSGALTTDSSGSYTLINDNSIPNINGIMGTSNAASFNGTTQCLASINLLNVMPASGLAIDFWFKANNGRPAYSNTFCIKKNTPVDYIHIYHLPTGKIIVSTRVNGGSTDYLYSNTLLPLGITDWFYLVVSWDTSYGLRMWINGVLQGSVGSAVNLMLNGSHHYFVIGANDADGGNEYGGIIDEFRVRDISGLDFGQRHVDQGYASKYIGSDISNNKNYDLLALGKEKDSSENYVTQIKSAQASRQGSNVYRYGGVFNKDDYIKLIGKVR